MAEGDSELGQRCRTVGTLALTHLLDRAPTEPGTETRLNAVEGVHLYRGLSGVLLGALATRDASLRDRLAELAIPALLIMSLGEPRHGPGLFDGLSGLVVTGAELLEVAEEMDVDEGAELLDGLVDRLIAALRLDYGRLQQHEAAYMGGLAGAGAGLLALSTRIDRPDLYERVPVLAERLARQALSAEDCHWLARDAESGLVYLNFSHGLAGIALFLARAGETLDQAIAIDAAAALGHEIWGKAVPVDGSGIDLLAVPKVLGSTSQTLAFEGVSWCHGVSGTLHLWAALDRVASHSTWGTALDHGFEYLHLVGEMIASEALFEAANRRRSRNPRELLSVSICHGLAGVVNGLMAFMDTSYRERALATARHFASAILRAGELDSAGGPAWLERYVTLNYETGDPEQTIWSVENYMAGSAGVAASLISYAQCLEGNAVGAPPELIGVQRV